MQNLTSEFIEPKMHKDYCFAFGLLLLPSGLKKMICEEGDRVTYFDFEYIIHSKFHQNPSSGSGEEVKNVNWHLLTWQLHKINVA